MVKENKYVEMEDSAWVVSTNAIHRWCVTELYTWNLCSFTKQCHPNKKEHFPGALNTSTIQDMPAFWGSAPKGPRLPPSCPLHYTSAQLGFNSPSDIVTDLSAPSLNLMRSLLASQAAPYFPFFSSTSSLRNSTHGCCSIQSSLTVPCPNSNPTTNPDYAGLEGRPQKTGPSLIFDWSWNSILEYTRYFERTTKEWALLQRTLR